MGVGGDLAGLVLAGTLKGQEILQSVGQTVLPLLLGRGTPGIQQVPPGSGSAPAVKASQKLFQILQPVPQLLRLRQRGKFIQKGVQTYRIKHMAAQTHSRGGGEGHPDVCLVIQA